RCASRNPVRRCAPRTTSTRWWRPSSAGSSTSSPWGACTWPILRSRASCASPDRCPSSCARCTSGRSACRRAEPGPTPRGVRSGAVVSRSREVYRPGMTSLRAALVMTSLRARRSKRFYADPSSMRGSLPSAQDPRKTIPPPSRCRGLHVRTEEVGGTGCHVFTPERVEQRTGTRILHLHGGAFVAEPDTHHWSFVRDVVLSTGAEVVFPIYPLAPTAEHEEIRHCAEAVYDHFLSEH